MPKYTEIVCAVDFSPTSVHALAHADDLAEQMGARLHLLHIVQNPLQQPWVVEAHSVNLLELTQEWVHQAEQEMATLAGQCKAKTVTAHRVGRIVDEVVSYLQEAKADLLVVGTHGHGVIAQLVLGSTAERLVRAAPCPVLSIRLPTPEKSMRR